MRAIALTSFARPVAVLACLCRLPAGAQEVPAAAEVPVVESHRELADMIVDGFEEVAEAVRAAADGRAITEATASLEQAGERLGEVAGKLERLDPPGAVVVFDYEAEFEGLIGSVSPQLTALSSRTLPGLPDGQRDAWQAAWVGFLKAASSIKGESARHFEGDGKMRAERRGPAGGARPPALPEAPRALVPMRTWTDGSGRTLEAELMSVVGDGASEERVGKFRRRNGQEFRLSLELLSAGDVELIRGAMGGGS